MIYLLAIHKDADSDYGVTVPDLPGCFSAGFSFEEALHNAHEAILCHLEGLALDNEAPPIAQSFETHQQNPDFQDAVWAVVEINEFQAAA